MPTQEAFFSCPSDSDTTDTFLFESNQLSTQVSVSLSLYVLNTYFKLEVYFLLFKCLTIIVIV